jgi:ribosomal-protein-alanine N-acetyltransferase
VTILEVSLLGFGAGEFRRLADDPAGYASARGFDLGENAALVQLVATNSAAFQERNGIEPPWGGYLALDPSTGVVLGTCGFKGPPGQDGAVEIAYFTFPGREGKGIGTAMALALSRLASREPGVRLLRAHTLPEPNASGKILTRVGYRHTADVVDPEDGPVWRWEREPMEV